MKRTTADEGDAGREGAGHGAAKKTRHGDEVQQPQGGGAAEAADAASPDSPAAGGAAGTPATPEEASAAGEAHLAAIACPSDVLDMDLSNRGMSTAPAATLAARFAHLTSLDLSRNVMKTFPTELCTLAALRTFDISRNQIRVLPDAVRGMRSLETFVMHANKLNHNSIPYDALASLPRLTLFDVRYNLKCKGAHARDNVRARLPPRIQAMVTVPEEQGPKTTGGAMGGIVGAHACDRDAVLLRSQLEPWHTPKLRERLRAVFGVETDVERDTREEIMQKLLGAYVARFPTAEYPINRTVRRVAHGRRVSDDVYLPLLAELRAWQQRRDPQSKERPTVRAEGYMILRSPLEFSNKNGQKAQLAAQKVARHQELWDLAEKVVAEVDPSFASLYTAVAFTDNFTGSPHIDTQNIGPFYGIALGEFTGGELCVESTPTEVTYIETHHRAVKVDGRHPHWVAPFEGQRFSVIFYQTIGEWTPMTTAVFI